MHFAFSCEFETPMRIKRMFLLLFIIIRETNLSFFEFKLFSFNFEEKINTFENEIKTIVIHIKLKYDLNFKELSAIFLFYLYLNILIQNK